MDATHDLFTYDPAAEAATLRRVANKMSDEATALPVRSLVAADLAKYAGNLVAAAVVIETAAAATEAALMAKPR